MNNLKNNLKKMKLSDLIWICKELHISCKKTDSKNRLIKKLLFPLSRKYKMHTNNKDIEFIPKNLPIQNYEESRKISIENLLNLIIIEIKEIQQQERDLRNEELENECPVCFEDTDLAELLPCEHQCCRPCADHIQNLDNLCPLCRGEIQSINST